MKLSATAITIDCLRSDCGVSALRLIVLGAIVRQRLKRRMHCQGANLVLVAAQFYSPVNVCHRRFLQTQNYTVSQKKHHRHQGAVNDRVLGYFGPLCRTN